eukprot:Anaeramoba_ignava/a42_28.p1 GENE.a42_28~~a42_28.p1  ORF type:complete len:375 (+),score=124.92 a42_28:1548-2672(+)
MFLSAIFNSEGDVIVSNSYGDLSLWDFKKIVCKKTIRAHSGPCTSLCQFKDSFIISGGRDSDLAMWDSLSLEKAPFNTRITGAGSVRSLDSDDKQIVVGTNKNQIWVVNADDNVQNCLISPHGDAVSSVSPHPSKNYFLTSSNERSVICWNSEEKSMAYKININGRADNLCFSPNGELIAVSMQGGAFTVFQTSTLRIIANRSEIQKHSSFISFSPNAQFLAIGFENGLINIHNSQSNYRKAMSFTVSPSVFTLDWSSCSSFIRVSNGQEIFHFSLEKNKNIDKIDDVVFDTNYCSSLIHLNNSIIPKTIQVHDNFVFAADNNFIKIFNGNDFSSVSFPSGHSNFVEKIAILKNSKLISVGGEDMSIFQWKFIN